MLAQVEMSKKAFQQHRKGGRLKRPLKVSLLSVAYLLLSLDQALLNSRPEGEAKVSNLTTQMERLLEQKELEESRKQEVQQLVSDAEKELHSALKAAEEALSKAEMQVLLDKQLEALQSKNDSFRSWIEELSENLTSLRGHQNPEEKLKIAQVSLQ